MHFKTYMIHMIDYKDYTNTSNQYIKYYLYLTLCNYKSICKNINWKWERDFVFTGDNSV